MVRHLHLQLRLEPREQRPQSPEDLQCVQPHWPVWFVRPEEQVEPQLRDSQGRLECRVHTLLWAQLQRPRPRVLVRPFAPFRVPPELPHRPQVAPLPTRQWVHRLLDEVQQRRLVESPERPLLDHRPRHLRYERLDVEEPVEPQLPHPHAETPVQPFLAPQFLRLYAVQPLVESPPQLRELRAAQHVASVAAV